MAEEDSNYPDEATVDAWLAGKLSPEEAAEVERRLEAADAADSEVEKIDVTALRGIPQVNEIRMQAIEENARLQQDREQSLESFMEGAGDLIGRYRLDKRIGRGGFGDVWLAQQIEPIKRSVALKVIKLGMDTEEVLMRFDAERQALAMMEHPNIASVLDAGATETGRPYFVMELVDGIPIDRFCNENGLTVEQRLRIFADVCSAVQHAHQKGVIHRDLKPSNILVGKSDQGEIVPKVIDFGLAKATTAPLTERTLQTRIEQVMGTPSYMSPEQASTTGGDVDTRSDVYSLGVLLYELITGTPPFDPDALIASGYEEMIRTIREVEPPTPSNRISTLGLPKGEHREQREANHAGLVKGLKKELDWVVMHALEKERERRYQSVGALGDDIDRYLAGEPVSVVAPTAGYRLAKFYRRNRVAVIAGLVFFLLVIVGAAVSGWQAWRATRNAERAIAGESAARLEAEKARRLVQMVKVMFDSADANNRTGPGYTVRQMLDDFSRGSMWEQIADDPEVEAELRGIIASCYQSMGRSEEALEHAARGLELRRRKSAGGNASLKVADDLANVAYLFYSMGNLDQAESLLQEGLDIERQFGNPKRVARTSMTLCKIYAGQGKLELAEEMARASLEIQVDQFQPGDEGDLLDARSTLALILRQLGKNEESLALYRQCDSDARSDLGIHPQTAGAAHNFATALRLAGQPVEAEKVFRDALQMRLKFLERGESKVCMTIHSLAQALEDQGRLEEAETLHRGALADRIRKGGSDHIDVARAQYWLADNLEKQNRQDEADDYRREAEAFIERQRNNPRP